jgi:hypothetical protein
VATNKTPCNPRECSILEIPGSERAPSIPTHLRQLLDSLQHTARTQPHSPRSGRSRRQCRHRGMISDDAHGAMRHLRHCRSKEDGSKLVDNSLGKLSVGNKDQCHAFARFQMSIDASSMATGCPNKGERSAHEKRTLLSKTTSKASGKSIKQGAANSNYLYIPSLGFGACQDVLS